MLPACFAWEWERYHTPVVAIGFQFITTLFLMNFEFSQLVILDTFFSNITLWLEFIAYIRLKYIEPDTRRDFVVPGGIRGAWCITLPKIIIISGVLLSQDWQVWRFMIGFNIIVVMAYFVWVRYRRCPASNALHYVRLEHSTSS